MMRRVSSAPRLLIGLATALALAAPTAHAASPIEKVPEGKDIPVEYWIAMATGRTLTYRTPEGAFFAREHYHPGGNRVTLQFADGSCIQGTWDHRPPRYCYHWEVEGSVCFRHVRFGDAALVIQQTEAGGDTSLIQIMGEVADAPLTCGPPLIGREEGIGVLPASLGDPR
jgi:hypothetical protein